MTTVALDAEEVSVLRETLEAQRIQLLTEITRADSREFRVLVVHRLEIIEHLIAHLPPRHAAA